ncbi:MAG: nicotinate-nucleotide--dimethylbenzimidazole phosphoribosyltransferase [Sphaerochaetaceae bacterium]
MKISYEVPVITPRSTALVQQAWAIWDGKVKPQLSLGRLEHLAVDIVSMRESLAPQLGTPCLFLFASDHGIVAEGVTSSPREITWQQCENFARGGGAIGLMCAQNGIDLQVIDMGVAHDFDASLGIIFQKIARGTQNFAHQAAMTQEQCYKALKAGQDVVRKSYRDGYMVVAFGEMGVGNTSSASALMASLTGYDLDRCTGKGAGLSEQGLIHKRAVLARALKFHGKIQDPLEALRTFGGFEIAAIAGGMLEAAHLKQVILVDGFITTVAALVAILVAPAVQDFMIFCHKSGESGHAALLDHLGATPLLSLSMRLGEGSGAALGWLVIRQAMDLYLGMNSFSGAQVTDSVELLKTQGVNAHA